MTGNRGFVLVNALVLVAALSAAALYLLSRAEGTRVRIGAAQQSQQIMFYLDAGEAWAITQLRGDRSGGSVDHLGEAWAGDAREYVLDTDMREAQLSGQIVDLQGLFNLNWLVGSKDPALISAFLTLCSLRGVAPSHAEAIVAALSANNSAAKPSSGAVVDLVGGPISMLSQLRDLPEIDAKIFAQLTTFVTALPSDSALNVNTTSAHVLATLLPGSNASDLGGVVQSALSRPFTSIEGFVDALPSTVSQDTLSNLDPEHFSVGSEWFRAEATVKLEGRAARRLMVLHRLPLPRGIEISYRLDNWN